MTSNTEKLTLAASPYKAEGRKVWKLEHNVPCRGSDLWFLPYPLCEVNSTTENPEHMARMIADAMNVHEILQATKNEGGQDAVRHWIKWFHRTQAHHTAKDPRTALDDWQDLETYTATLIARFGLVAVIQDTCRRMAEHLPAPSTIQP